MLVLSAVRSKEDKTRSMKGGLGVIIVSVDDHIALGVKKYWMDRKQAGLTEVISKTKGTWKDSYLELD